MDHKIRENRLRRVAERRGCQLLKSRRRDPDALDYGGYMLVDIYTNGVILGGSPYAYSAELDEVEEYFYPEQTTRKGGSKKGTTKTRKMKS